MTKVQREEENMSLILSLEKEQCLIVVAIVHAKRRNVVPIM